MNILFWNTYNKNVGNINNCLIELIQENKCDIVILAEYADDISSFCQLINRKSLFEYSTMPNIKICNRIKGITINDYIIINLQEQTHYQIVMLKILNTRIIIAMIHNISKMHYTESTQEEVLRIFIKDICEAENYYSTKNTIIIGDLNINPFDNACISASILHAIPFMNEVKNTTRMVQNREYQKFYNPTWKFYGNRSIPYTSYYKNNSDMINFYWNVFDQVIIRPQMINAFCDDTFKIIYKTMNHILIQADKPDKINYSDHLPIFCTFNEERL